MSICLDLENNNNSVEKIQFVIHGMLNKQPRFELQHDRNTVNTDKEIEMRELALSEAHVLSKKPQPGPKPGETYPAAGSRRRAPDDLRYKLNRCGT